MEAAIVRASIQVFDARITSSKLNLKIRSDYNYIFALNISRVLYIKYSVKRVKKV